MSRLDKCLYCDSYYDENLFAMKNLLIKLSILSLLSWLRHFQLSHSESIDTLLSHLRHITIANLLMRLLILLLLSPPNLWKMGLLRGLQDILCVSPMSLPAPKELTVHKKAWLLALELAVTNYPNSSMSLTTRI